VAQESDRYRALEVSLENPDLPTERDQGIGRKAVYEIGVGL
jgi:hypothetical protein